MNVKPPDLMDYATYCATYILDDEFADAHREWLRDFCRWARWGNLKRPPDETALIAKADRLSAVADGPLLTERELEAIHNFARRLGYLRDRRAGDGDA